MSEPEDKDQKRGFKVEDRRRFSETGDARSDRDDEPAAESPTASAAATAERLAEARAEAPRRDAPPFEINFSTFVLSLSTQALAHLGEIPDPISSRTEIDLGAAKQMIDILGLLKDKTIGNLEKSETALLDSVLYDLRLKYVERVRGQS